MTAAEFHELRAFLAVADERSFRRAARRLGLSPSALSRTIRALEARLNVRLLNRTTRSVAPTEAGQRLHAEIRPLVAQMDAAVRELGTYQASPKGTVRLNLSRAAATVAILPRLGGFLATYPDVRLDLVVDDDLTDVVARGFDAGIRLGDQVGRDMVAVRVTPDFRMAVVGTSAYFAAHPPPERPEDLARHRCLTYRWASSGALAPWGFHGPDGPMAVEIESVLTVNDTELLRGAALRGAGLALLAETAVACDIARGALVRVLATWCAPMPGFRLYYANRSHMPAALRAFIDYMKLPEARASLGFV